MKKLENVHPSYPPSEKIYADRAEDYIKNSYKNKITVSDIAAFVQISEGYLHRIFKNVKGVGVLEYVNNYRIMVAVSLLKNQKLALKDAAYNVGINDPAYMKTFQTYDRHKLQGICDAKEKCYHRELI